MQELNGLSNGHAVNGGAKAEAQAVCGNRRVELVNESYSLESPAGSTVQITRPRSTHKKINKAGTDVIVK